MLAHHLTRLALAQGCLQAAPPRDPPPVPTQDASLARTEPKRD